MLKVFLAACILIGFGVFIMSFNIIFRKKPFPNSDIGTNEDMRRRGIRCFKEDDAALHRGCSMDCSSCNIYENKDKS